MAYDLSQAISRLQDFSGANLTDRLAEVEARLRGATIETYGDALAPSGATSETLAAAGIVKRLVGQINVVIHAVGMLLCLPQILQDGEEIQYVSLGAGNTDRPFDLETDRRIAEFKFIWWRGGPESIRQNGLFKDFYYLAEAVTGKTKYLYVLGTAHPVKFLNGRRKLTSVLKDYTLQKAFFEKFGTQFEIVADYYAMRKQAVIIEDISAYVPELSEVPIEAASDGL